MTRTDKINNLKVLLGYEVPEEVISTYLDLAEAKVLSVAYPYDDTVTEVPRKYEMVALEIAVYLINKRGAEGESSHTENGIVRYYENADIPKSLIQKIVPHCGVIG